VARKMVWSFTRW